MSTTNSVMTAADNRIIPHDSPQLSGERLVEIKLPSQRLSEPALTKNLEYTTNKFALCGKSQTCHGRVLEAHTEVTAEIILNLKRILWAIRTSGVDTEGS